MHLGGQGWKLRCMYILSFPGLVSLTQSVKSVTLLPHRHDVCWIWNLVSLVNWGPGNFTVVKRWKNKRIAGACSCLCSMVFCRGSRTRRHCNVLLLRHNLKCSGLCSSRARWPLATNFCSRATRKSQIFHTNHMLGILDFTGSEHWAPFSFP